MINTYSYSHDAFCARSVNKIALYIVHVGVFPPVLVNNILKFIHDLKDVQQ